MIELRLGIRGNNIMFTILVNRCPTELPPNSNMERPQEPNPCSTMAMLDTWAAEMCVVIVIDHDTVCAGVVGTAIRHSTSCAGRCAAAPAAPAGTTSAVPDCSTNHDSADRISGQFLFYHDQNFTKSKGNLRFRRPVPLFVPIGVCVTTHDDGTVSDATIG